MSRERFLLWECEKVKRKEKGIEKRALEGRCGSVRTWDLEKSGFCFCIWGKAGRRVRFYLRTWLEVKTEENQSKICLAETILRPFLLNSHS